ncbi:MAG: DNA polymerase I [Candidatus Omnitrophica bacterium]|nr:DNA polymerase I [Candidatus Omnitrophota bacterium]
MRRLYLIDATAFCYRAFFAVRGLSTSFGQPTNAVYGFINILNKILKEKKPDYLGVCFDVSRDTFRQKKFAEYKIHRPPMPDGLSSQIPLIKEIVSHYGIAIFEKEGFEADDIIATIAKKASEKPGLAVTIVSSDKDILQLVDEHTVVFSPYKDTGLTYDYKMVLERFGVKPERIADILALMGDEVDNIPGLPGIGEKTARELISTFGSLDQLLNNINKVKEDKIKKIITENIEKVNLNKELVLLDKNVDIDFDLERLKIGQPNFKELFRLFKYLEFKRFLKGLPVEKENVSDAKLELVEDRDFRGIVDETGTLVLFGCISDDLIFQAKNKSFRLNQGSRELKPVLEDPTVKKIGHDLKKIKVSLAKENISLQGLYFDTMVAAYLVNPSKPGYGLTDVAWDYLGECNTSEAVSAKALDTIAKLKVELEKELQEKSLSKLFFELEMPLVEVLAGMELNGIKLDLEILKTLSADIENKLIKLIEDIYRESGQQFNINSPKQLREILFNKLKLPVGKKSKTGPSTDEAVLRGLADKHKLPHFLLEYRQLVKLKNTYIDTLPNLVDKVTGRVHTSFNQTGTETGRLSSSSPNLQNIPLKSEIGKNIRRAIISSGKDYCLLSCDYSQIELRILAHLSKDENLIAAFKKNKDIHRATAALIYGLEEKDVTSPMRETAKRVNFGIVYGLTAYGLSRDLGIPVDGAGGFIDAYFLRYPKVKEYIEEQIKKVETCGFATTLLGRRRYIPEINSKNQGIRQFAQRKAINTPIQGCASDLIKLAMLKIHDEIRKKKLKEKMILQIHDELVFDCAREELKDFTDFVRMKMENVLELDVPIKVDIKQGMNWLEMEEVR